MPLLWLSFFPSVISPQFPPFSASGFIRDAVIGQCNLYHANIKAGRQIVTTAFLSEITAEHRQVQRALSIDFPVEIVMFLHNPFGFGFEDAWFPCYHERSGRKWCQGLPVQNLWWPSYSLRPID